MKLEYSRSAAENNIFFRCILRFLLSAILSGSQIFGCCAPFGLGFVAAAGSGIDGLSALAGILVGSLLFMPFIDAMKYIAAAILIFSVSLSFFDTKIYQKAAFMPAIASACTASVGFIYIFHSDFFSLGSAYCLLETLLAGGSTVCYRIALTEKLSLQNRVHQIAFFFLLLTLLIAVCTAPFVWDLSIGRILAVLLVLSAGRVHKSAPSHCIIGLCAGLAMDMVTGTLFYSTAFALSAVIANWKPCSRSVYTLLFLAGTLFSLFWAENSSIPVLMETTLAGILFLLIPEKAFQKRRVSHKKETATTPSSALASQLRSTASVFRDLYDSLSQQAPPINDENIATVFDRSADQICRSCPLCGTCWDNDYVTTYNALNDITALLTGRGHVRPSDFPSHFSERCVRIHDFTATINAEFTALLMRRQYTRQLDSTRQSAKEQYARLSEMLSASADQISRAEHAATPAAAFTPSAKCEIHTAVRPKDGENVSGDTLSTFQREDGTVFLLLSDGMGSGEAARRESAMTIRLLEQFLKAGIEAPTALKTLNTALTLHSDESGSFTTIDLLVFSPASGIASFYKYGAAPSYIKHGSHVRRITGSILPAGLSGNEQQPDATTLCLSPGDRVLLISDGFADSNNDLWLQTFLSQWAADSAQSLTSALMDASLNHHGRTDDASILLLQIPSAETLPSTEV